MSPVHGSSSDSTVPGVLSENSAAGGRGVMGSGVGNGVGVLGQNDTGDAIFGISTNGRGVVGVSSSDIREATSGYNSKPDAPAGPAVNGISIAGPGVHGHSSKQTGVLGDSDTGDGVVGNATTGRGVVGNSASSTGVGVLGQNEIEPGTVMVIDKHGKLQASQEAYDKRVAGVISGAGDLKPGIVLGSQRSGKKRVPIALLGTVYCKVDPRCSAIEVGDMLTTSVLTG